MSSGGRRLRAARRQERDEMLTSEGWTAVVMVRTPPRTKETDIMRWLRGRATATAALVAAMGMMVVTTSGAVAAPAGCAAQDFLDENDTLRPGRALCNGSYLLRMQENGDLVLREISTGRPCWHSNTSVAGVSATFERGKGGHPPTQPKLKVGNHVIEGLNTGNHIGTTANLNAKGELWIGYDREGWC
jgi:hypothetical protein